ncbi:YkgJ family cysteine cluster protein [Archaeoglobus sp.]
MYAIYRTEGIEVAIPFECRMCGKCCEKLSQCVYDPLSGKIIAETEFGLFDYIELDVDAKSPVLIKLCPFLKDGKCEVHEIRPKSCRDFPLTERGDCGVDARVTEKSWRESGKLRAQLENLNLLGWSTTAINRCLQEVVS